MTGSEGHLRIDNNHHLPLDVPGVVPALADRQTIVDLDRLERLLELRIPVLLLDLRALDIAPLGQP